MSSNSNQERDRPLLPAASSGVIEGAPRRFIRISGSSGNHGQPAVREIHKNAWLKRIVGSSEKKGTFLPKKEKYWVVFCIHDDVEAFLEFYIEAKVGTANHKPTFAISLNTCLHVSPSIMGEENEEHQFAVTLPSEVIRLQASSYAQMSEWLESLQGKLRDMKVLGPKDNLYSKLPDPPVLRHPIIPGIIGGRTRDPNSPLPPTPPIRPNHHSRQSNPLIDLREDNENSPGRLNVLETPLDHSAITSVVVNGSTEPLLPALSEIFVSSEASSASGRPSTSASSQQLPIRVRNHEADGIRVNQASRPSRPDAPLRYNTVIELGNPLTSSELPGPSSQIREIGPSQIRVKVSEMVQGKSKESRPKKEPSQPTSSHNSRLGENLYEPLFVNPNSTNEQSIIEVTPAIPKKNPQSRVLHKRSSQNTPKSGRGRHVEEHGEIQPLNGSPSAHNGRSHSIDRENQPMDSILGISGEAYRMSRDNVTGRSNREGAIQYTAVSFPASSNLSLKEQQVLRLRTEINHAGGVRIVLKKKDCVESIALIDYLGAVWVAGWKQNDHPVLKYAFHIGDQIVKVAGVTIQNSIEAVRAIKMVSSLQVEFLVKRVPFGKIFVFKRSVEGQKLGIDLEGNSGEIGDVCGLCGEQGLTPKAQSTDGVSLVNWFITEVNNSPLCLFSRGNEVKERLNAVGKNISVLVQPADLVKQMKKQLKKFKDYKEFQTT